MAGQIRRELQKGDFDCMMKKSTTVSTPTNGFLKKQTSVDESHAVWHVLSLDEEVMMGARILIIDAEGERTDHLFDQLKSAGHQVSIVSSTEAAIGPMVSRA